MRCSCDGDKRELLPYDSVVIQWRYCGVLYCIIGIWKWPTRASNHFQMSLHCSMKYLGCLWLWKSRESTSAPTNDSSIFYYGTSLSLLVSCPLNSMRSPCKKLGRQWPQISPNPKYLKFSYLGNQWPVWDEAHTRQTVLVSITHNPMVPFAIIWSLIENRTRESSFGAPKNWK